MSYRTPPVSIRRPPLTAMLFCVPGACRVAIRHLRKGVRPSLLCRDFLRPSVRYVSQRVLISSHKKACLRLFSLHYAAGYNESEWREWDGNDAMLWHGRREEEEDRARQHEMAWRRRRATSEGWAKKGYARFGDMGSRVPD